MDVIAVFRAEALGDRNTEADAGALYESQCQKMQGIGGTDRSQCGNTEEPSYDHGIRKAVQLLK